MRVSKLLTLQFDHAPPPPIMLLVGVPVPPAAVEIEDPPIVPAPPRALDHGVPLGTLELELLLPGKLFHHHQLYPPNPPPPAQGGCCWPWP